MNATDGADTAPPLLGVAGHWGVAEITLARRFDDLHQFIYTQGGIRPSNAAVEEVAKLVFIRLWTLRHPWAQLTPTTRASDLFAHATSARATDHDLGAEVRAAFALALRSPDLVAAGPGGAADPIWPLDEPFRLTHPAVLAAAMTLVARIIDHDRPTVSDPLGTAFDALLAGRYDHAGGLGTYLTPSGVARMMAEVTADLLTDLGDGPFTGDDAPGFGDPCCGTGRFLVAMLEVLRERGDPTTTKILRAGAFGTDQSSSSVAKARINMLLYGVERPLVWTVNDSVTDHDLRQFAGRVPAILTNPPFGEGKYDDNAGLIETAAMMPRLSGKRRIDPALACLALSIRLLTPGGVLGIVLPDGVIGSRTFTDLIAARISRSATTHSDAPNGDASLPDEVASLPYGVELVANISLPTSTFSLSGTVAKTSAVFLRRTTTRQRPEPRMIAMARIDHVGYLRQAGRAAPDPGGNDLPRLPALVRTALATAGSATVSITSSDPLVAVAAAASLTSLEVSRLDPVAMAARRALTERGGVELRELVTVKKAPRARAVATPFVSVLHVDDLGTVDWCEAHTHLPATPGYLVEEGDLIVSLLNPSKLRAAVIAGTTEPVQISSEFGVFSATCDPYAVIGILYSAKVRAQLRPLGTGTSSSRRRIDTDDVLSLVVPKLATATLDELGRSVREATRLVALGRERLTQRFAAVDGATPEWLRG